MATRSYSVPAISCEDCKQAIESEVNASLSARPLCRALLR
jgi:hypothetical protein